MMDATQLIEQIKAKDNIIEQVQTLLPYTPYDEKIHNAIIDEALKQNDYNVARVVLLTDFANAINSNDNATALTLYKDDRAYNFNSMLGEKVGKKLCGKKYKAFCEYKKAQKTPTTNVTDEQPLTAFDEHIQDYYDSKKSIDDIIESIEPPKDKQPPIKTFDKAYNEVSGTDAGTQLNDQPYQFISLFNNNGEKAYKTLNFECKKDGIYRHYQKGGGDNSEKVSSTLMYIDKVFEDIETNVHTYHLNYLKGGKWKCKTVGATTLASKNEIIQLSNYGIDANSNNAKELINYFRTFLNESLANLELSKNCSHLGWYGKQFIPYGTDIQLIDSVDTNPYIEALKPVGNENIQRDTIKRYTDMDVLTRFVVGGALGSILIKPLKRLPYVIHLWGGTGNGKSALGQFVLSLFGNPSKDSALFHTMNSTINAVEKNLIMLNSLPFYADELQLIKTNGATYDKFIMSVAEQKGRERLHRDATIQTTGTWNCATISTGEEPILKQNSGGGAYNRTFEIESTTKLFGGEFTEMYQSIYNNYGYVGKQFIEAVSKISNDDLQEKFLNIHKGFVNVNSDEKQKNSMSIIILAYSLFNQLIFDNELTPLTIDDVTIYMNSTNEIKSSFRAMQFVRDYISQNINRFAGQSEYMEQWGSAHTINNTNEIDTVYFSKTKFAEILEANNYNFNSVKKDWAKWGFLILPNKKNAYTHYTLVNNIYAHYVMLDLSKDIHEQN